MEQRRCKKCLTREMDADEYFKNLHEYIAGIDEELKEGMCRSCGCYVELRAVMKKNRCPNDKWLA